MSSTRDRIIETASDLMERQGFHATGINQIVKESGAPKGSLYHYFPEGKDEIAEEAIRWAGRGLADRIDHGLAACDTAAEAVRLFITNIALYVEASDFQYGGPLMTVAMETATSNWRLNMACREAYSLLQATFETKLVASGYAEAQACRLATFITAAIEGGIILCRTYHSGDPLRLVAEQLGRMLESAAAP